MDIRQAESHRIMEITRRRDNVPVRVTMSMQDLIERASTQSFVPVVDDTDTFIGIITRRSIINYCREKFFPFPLLCDGGRGIFADNLAAPAEKRRS